MAAAHLRGPDLGQDVMAAFGLFVPGCMGKVRQHRREAAAAVARRGRGQAWRCSKCGSFHTSRLSGPAVHSVRYGVRLPPPGNISHQKEQTP